MENLLEQKLLTAKVTKISWERIWLFLDVEIAFAPDADKFSELSFYLVNGEFQAKAKLKIVDVEDSVYHLKINLTNPGNGLCLPAGKYTIFVCQNNCQMATAEADVSIVKKLSDSSRNFLFGNTKKVYTATFYVADDDDERLPLVMRTMASKIIGVGAPGSKQKEKQGFNPKRILKKAYAKRRNKIKRNIYKFYRRRYKNKSQKPTVLFLSEQSTTIGTNLKAVKDCMERRGLDKDFQILESYRSSVTDVHMGMRSWMVMLKKFAKADYIFMDDHAPVLDWMVLDPDTTIVQLWHAGAGFKSSGYSRWGHMGCPAPYSCHRQYKYGIAGSKHIRHFFSEVWGINDSQVLPLGMPRIDEFLDEDYRKAKTEELYAQYPMCKGKKVILFAPTYRGKNKANAHYPYELIDFKRLYELCGDEYVVLFKMHPWVADPVPVPAEYQDKFVDVNLYPNINDLFYITELLITDYSSNIFEYSLMRKPMLFFAYDEIQYSFSRGFHRDYQDSAPGKICYTFAEVLKAIETKDFEYEKVEEYVEKHFDYIDSHASDRVIDWILLGQMPDFVKQDLEADAAINRELEELDFTTGNLEIEEL